MKRDRSPFPTLNYIRSVYIGATSPNILKTRDNELTAFGKGAEFKKGEIISKIIEILAKKNVINLKIQTSEHHAIRYYVKGNAFAKFVKSPERLIIQDVQPIAPIQDLQLYQKLMKMRQFIASQVNIPEEKLISTSTVQLISNQRPTSEPGLKKIFGMTSQIFNSVGYYFLQTISSHQTSNCQNVPTDSSTPHIPPKQTLPLPSKRVISPKQLSSNPVPLITNQFPQQLLEQLIFSRKQLAECYCTSEDKLIPYSLLRTIALKLPSNETEFKEIPGVTSEIYSIIGSVFLDILISYRDSNSIFVDQRSPSSRKKKIAQPLPQFPAKKVANVPQTIALPSPVLQNHL